ncbi:MAG: MBL fold metallo-hydrolase [Phycisphaerae bacterium]|nr:MBL fold metallo-hydrolase [Phycisphaerae bacterium]
MMRQGVWVAVTLGLCVGLLAHADEPDKKNGSPLGTTTKPLEPGDVGQTTIAPTAKDGPLPLAIRWWGQSCISIETFWGFTIVIDPFPPDERLGYPGPNLAAELVLISDARPSRSAADTVRGEPVILRGHGEAAAVDHILDRAPNQPEATVRPSSEVGKPSLHAVRVRGIPVSTSGPEPHLGMMFLLEVDGVRILHCDGLGQPLTEEQIDAIGPIDVLLLPVGEAGGLGAADAAGVVRKLKPTRLVWPLRCIADGGDSTMDPIDAFVRETRRANLLVRQVKGNTVAITRLPAGRRPPVGSPAVILAERRPIHPEPDVERALLGARKDRQTMIDDLGGISDAQLDHRPSDGTHTIRWNFEHTTARELGFFSQIYHAIDPEIPVINWNPAQMPPDFVPWHPDWGTQEMVRHVRRIEGFTERFSYLLADAPPTMRIENTHFSIKYLTALIVGHYQNHTGKAVHKFTLPDWPRK